MPAFALVTPWRAGVPRTIGDIIFACPTSLRVQVKRLIVGGVQALFPVLHSM
jgi:hypothetical protein